MKKGKITAALLALALIISLPAARVFGQEHIGIATPNSIAGVEFQYRHLRPQITSNDEDELPGGIHDLGGLDFHRHYISPHNQLYLSWADGDPLLQSAIGLPIYTSVSFQVQASLSPFHVIDSGIPSNMGARLTFDLGGQHMDNGSHVWQSWDETNPATVTLFPGAANGTMTAGGASVVIARGDRFPEGVPHRWAANMTGSLLVPSGTARPGQSQAQIVWSIIPLPNF